MWISHLKLNHKAAIAHSSHIFKSAPETPDSLSIGAIVLKPLFAAIRASIGNMSPLVGMDTEHSLTFLAVEANEENIGELEYKMAFGSHFFFSIVAMCFLMILWPLQVNKCRMASSVVMSFGCFFFFLG